MVYESFSHYRWASLVFIYLKICSLRLNDHFFRILAPTSPLDVSAALVSGYSVCVTWKAPKDLNGVLLPYEVNCNVVKEPPSRTVNTVGNDVVISDLLPLKTYECVVVAQTQANSHQNQDDLKTTSAKSIAINTWPESKWTLKQKCISRTTNNDYEDC